MGLVFKFLTAWIVPWLLGSILAPVFGKDAKCDQPELIRVPLTRQSTDYTCGVAAVQSVFGYYGDEVREDILAKLLQAEPKNGTKYENIVSVAKSKGYNVEVHKNMRFEGLTALLDQRKPVICLIQAWSDNPTNYENDWDDGHYVVAIGHDKKNVYFMDPSTLGNYTFIPIAEFLKRWHDTDTEVKLHNFAMVIEKAKPTFKSDAITKIE